MYCKQHFWHLRNYDFLCFLAFMEPLGSHSEQQGVRFCDMRRMLFLSR
jgi:hypothetical protein